jgi:uncharacterized protein
MVLVEWAAHRSLGSVISELARRGLTPARVEADDGLPVIRVPAGTPPTTPEMVLRALDEDRAFSVGMLDVNALVALAWDSHVHHAAMVLAALRAHPGQRFLADDVSMSDSDVPAIAGYRRVTDAHLLTLARRSGMPLVTFDARILAPGAGNDVEVLATL